MFRDRSVGEEPASTVNDGFAQTGSSRSMTASSSTAPRRSDPRQRLLEAMIETVSLRGYDRTTISRVLSVAGLEEAVFSEHFRDKRDCFTQAVDGLLCAGELAALELFETRLPWPELVRLGLALLLRALAGNPAAARVLLVETLGAGPEMCERRRASTVLLTTLMERGREESASARQLPAQTSEAIVGGVLSILHRRALEGELAKLPELHRDLAYFALLPYVEHRRATELVDAPPAAPSTRSR